MKSPLVTVVIPTYNREKYIERAIKSVYDQRYKNWELVVVDDGSTDSTEKIVNSYPRGSYIYQAKAGAAAAMNRGIEVANGKYIAFLASDDIYLPNFLQESVKVLENENVDMTFTSFYYIDERDTITGVFPLQEYPQREFLAFWLACNRINSSTTVLRADMVRKIGSFDEKVMGDCDGNFYIRFLRHKNVAGINKCLVKYRKHDGQMSRDRKEASYWVDKNREWAIKEYLEPIDLFHTRNNKAVCHNYYLLSKAFGWQYNKTFRTAIACLNKSRQFGFKWQQYPRLVWVWLQFVVYQVWSKL